MKREAIRELAHLMIKSKWKKKGCAMFLQMTLNNTYQKAQDYIKKMEEIGILRTFEEANNSVVINDRLIKKSINPINKIIDEYFDAEEEE